MEGDLQIKSVGFISTSVGKRDEKEPSLLWAIETEITVRFALDDFTQDLITHSKVFTNESWQLVKNGCGVIHCR